MNKDKEIKELKELTTKAMSSFETIIKNINKNKLKNKKEELAKKVEKHNEDKR